MGKIKEGLLQTDSKTLVDDIEREVNNFSFKEKDAIKEIIDTGLEARFMILAGEWISFMTWELDHNMYDLRNDYSCHMCQKLDNADVDLLLIKAGRAEAGDYYETVHEAAPYMRGVHHTLQQTFSGMVFEYLAEGMENGTLPEDVEDALNGIGLEPWWQNCPFI